MFEPLFVAFGAHEVGVVGAEELFAVGTGDLGLVVFLRFHWVSRVV